MPPFDCISTGEKELWPFVKFTGYEGSYDEWAEERWGLGGTEFSVNDHCISVIVIVIVAWCSDAKFAN